MNSGNYIPGNHSHKQIVFSLYMVNDCHAKTSLKQCCPMVAFEQILRSGKLKVCFEALAPKMDLEQIGGILHLIDVLEVGEQGAGNE